MSPSDRRAMEACHQAQAASDLALLLEMRSLARLPETIDALTAIIWQELRSMRTRAPRRTRQAPDATAPARPRGHAARTQRNSSTIAKPRR